MGNSVGAVEKSLGRYAIPRVQGLAVTEEVGHNVAKFLVKTELAEEIDNHFMVHRRKELSDVNSEYRCVKPSVPILGDYVHKNDADVSGSVFGNAAELAWMEEAVCNAVELESFGEDLGHEFANCIEQGDWAESLGNVVAILLRFGNDARVGNVELCVL